MNSLSPRKRKWDEQKNKKDGAYVLPKGKPHQ